jgi:arylsulfatase A-like enzyme
MKYVACMFLSMLIFNISLKAQKKVAVKPNIIFILVDDQGYGDLGAFFQNQRAKANDRSKPWEYSPNLDKLASGGAMLTQHYASAPVCAPSRASILLGVSQGHSNVRDNQFDKALEDNYTMASTLRELGYSTAAIGKWGLQGDRRWDANGASWPAKPRNRGFDYFYGYMRHKDGHEHYPKEGPYDGPKEVWDNGTNVVAGLDKCYTADLWTAIAKKYITDHQKGKDADKPFFIYLAYETPHAVLELPTMKYPEGGGLHGGIQYTGTPGHMINTAEGTIDSWTHPDYNNATYDDDRNAATPEVPWPDTYKRYATANRRIDDGVGDLVQLLKDLKIDSNTVIVYTSDNGPSIESYLPKNYVPNHPTFFGSYGPFDGIKRDNWEGGVRMPTIANWPGHIPPGKVVTFPSISYAWAPTFIDIAGMPAPARMDGVSMLPSLTGKGNQLPSVIYNEYYNNGKTPDFKDFSPDHRGRVRKQMQWIRIGDYVGVRYDVKSEEDDFEIYNVVKDPGQRHNLSATNAKAKVPKVAQNISIAALQQMMEDKALQMRRPDTAAVRPYDQALIPSTDNIEVEPGIKWKEYKDIFPWIPQVARLQPSASGDANQVGINKKTNHNGILYFEGYIRIPTDGKYVFYIRSNTKALLRIHDAKVIDADYHHTPDHTYSSSVLLKKGLHPFRLYCRQQKGASLDWQWEGPQMQRQPIPKEAFFRSSE